MDRFIINRSRGKLMGVAAGLADWLKVDVLIVRLAILAGFLITGPIAVLFYVLTGWLASDDR